MSNTCKRSVYRYDEEGIKNRKTSYPIHPLLHGRRSLRRMTGETIGNDTLNSLFEAARWAPSHFNTQNWRFVYVKRDTANTDVWNDFLNSLWEGNRRWAADAAVLVAVLSKKSYLYNDRIEPLPSHSFEAGSAWMSMALEGTARGLIMHAMGGFDQDAIRKAIGLDDNDYQVDVIVSIGKPAAVEKDEDREDITQRLPIDKFVSNEKFEEKVFQN